MRELVEVVVISEKTMEERKDRIGSDLSALCLSVCLFV